LRRATGRENMVRILIWVVMLFGGAGLGIWLDWHWFHGLFASPFFHVLTLIAGGLVLRFVLRTSRYTGRLLARMGRQGNAPRMQTNKLVTTGVYSCMRHPMHLGLLFFPWSVALILGSVSFIVCIAPLEMLFMLAMIKWVEEPEAIEKFGEAYREYQGQAPMFDLRLSCLRQMQGQEPQDR